MAKLYTRTGDDGTTGLFGGGRVLKDHPRVEAYGTVDELNAALGLCLATINSHDPTINTKPGQGPINLKSDQGAINLKPGQSPIAGSAGSPKPPVGAPARVSPITVIATLFTPILTTLQSRLFDLGADLATPHGTPHESKVARISQSHIDESEKWIDLIDSGNTPMTQFILPGGTELAARLHLARTICRRAERCVITLQRETPTINTAAVVYLNRISDMLFAMARRANRETGVDDVPWVK
jgi:cob(I)alamin adenosyltransferase